MQTQNRRNNRPSQSSRSYYSYGNVAYDTNPVYEPQRPQRQSQRQAKPVQRPKNQPVASARESVGLVVFKYIVVMALTFFGCLIYMGISVQADNASMLLRQEKELYTTLKSTNNIAEAEITEKLDLDYIRTEAISRLGMVEPESYQVVYIDVPKESYTIQYAGEEDFIEEDETSLFSLLFSLN